MPVRHEIDVNAGRVVVHLSGGITAGEILAFYGKLADDPALQPGLTVFADCRQVTAVPGFPEMSMVANAQPRISPHMRPTRAAVVVEASWLYGIIRQFGALAERNGIRVVPFYDFDEAAEWLASEWEVTRVANGDDSSSVERA